MILKEIPYKNSAYIHIRDVQDAFFGEHLAECVSFCQMAGAEHIYAAGHAFLEQYPLYTAVLEMRGTAWIDTEKVRNLFPVTEETVSRWRQLYNEKMRSVDNTATLESRDEKQILKSGGAYFIHKDGKLLGLGWLQGTKLLAVAAAEKGAGEQVLHTLMSLVEGETMTLEVAATNGQAIHLYEKLGFVKVKEVSRWYRVL